MISAGPVIRKWLEDVVQPTGICAAQVASLLLCFGVMDLLLQVNTGRVTPEVLAAAIASHYAAHIVAYGYELFVPKHHYMLHIPRQLAMFTFLIACFVHERKHKIVKRWALPLCTGNNRDFERSLLEECTVAHMESLKEPLLKPTLRETAAACPNAVAALRSHGFASAESARTGRFLRVQGRTIAMGDVGFYRGSGHNDIRVGEVYYHVILGDQLLAVVSHWPLKEGTSKWKKVIVTNNMTIVPSAWLLQSVIYAPAAVGNKATVLMPAEA